MGHGELYTRTGRYEEGLKTDLELTRICPREAIAWYNLGCSYALIGHSERRQSVQHRECSRGVRSTVVEPVQDVAMEIDVTHGVLLCTAVQRSVPKCLK